ncbi:hypothetical protein LCGC14_2738250, partial [marine sediment metagenome]
MADQDRVLLSIFTKSYSYTIVTSHSHAEDFRDGWEDKLEQEKIRVSGR